MDMHTRCDKYGGFSMKVGNSRGQPRGVQGLTPTPTPQGGGHSHGCQGADPSGVDPRVWHLPLDHTVQVYNIFIIILR